MAPLGRGRGQDFLGINVEKFGRSIADVPASIATELMSTTLENWYQATSSLLRTRGYEACGTRIQNSVACEWHRAPSSNAFVSAYLAFERKPKLGGYALYFGFECIRARELMERVAPKFKQLLPSTGFNADYLCWTLFHAGRALNWPVLVIPDPTGGILPINQWAMLTREVLEKTVEAVSSCNDVLHILRRNDKPFEWFASSGVVRATECLAIGRILGFTVSDLRNEVAAHMDQVSSEYRKNEIWDGVIDALMS